MAQYGQGFYGEMYYGVMGAKYGTYTTNTMNTPGNFQIQGDMCVVVTLEDIKVNYKTKTVSLSDIEVFSFDANWTDTGTNFVSSAADAVSTYNFTGSNCSVVYSGGPINYEITTIDEAGVRTAGATGTLPANGSLTEVAIPTTEYINYEIKLTCPLNTTIDSGYVFVCGTKLELKAANTDTALKAATFTKASILSQSVTQVSDTKYLRTVTYNANVFKTYSKFIYKLTLLSSDSSKEVWVDRVEVKSLDPQLFMEKCTYTKLLDLVSVLGSTNYTAMTEFDVIAWTETIPEGTSAEVRTSAGSDPVSNMSLYTPSYKSGGMQARLRPGQTRGWITTPSYSFDVMNGDANTTTRALLSKVDIGYTLASSRLGVGDDVTYGIIYSVMVDGLDNKMARISAEYHDIVERGITIEGKKAQVLIEFKNYQLYFSPTVDYVDLTAQCIYGETKTKTGLKLSAVEQIKDLTDITSFGFKVDTHPWISSANYSISSPDSGVNSYKLFFKSTSGINISDKVVINKGANDVMCGYSKLPISISNRLQNVRFGDGILNGDDYTLTLKMINNFKEPTLVQGKTYLFRMISGVVSTSLTGDRYVLVEDESTKDALSSFTFATPSVGRTDYTEKSIFNGETTNDTINLTTQFNTDVDAMIWTSEEKILNGSVNVLGDQMDINLEITDLPDIDPQVFISNVVGLTYDKDASNNNILQDAYSGPYRFKILENSVFSTPKADSQIPVSRDRIDIKAVSLVQSPSAISASAILTRGRKPYVDGTPSNADEIPSLYVQEVRAISQTITTNGSSSTTTFSQGVSWTFNQSSRTIIWSTEVGVAKPAPGTDYSVEYTYLPYTSAVITLGCDYSEDIIEKSGWTSTHSVIINGSCTPLNDDVKDLSLYAPKIIDTWPDIDEVAQDENIDSSTLRYFVYSTDNEFVTSRIEDNKLYSGMQGMNPDEDWLLKIKGGYYYLGKDEYFMYNSKTTVAIDENLPVVVNCEYTVGAELNSGAIISHDEIVSLVLNNDFENEAVSTSRQIVPTGSFTFSSEQATDKVFWL